MDPNASRPMLMQDSSSSSMVPMYSAFTPLTTAPLQHHSYHDHPRVPFYSPASSSSSAPPAHTHQCLARDNGGGHVGLKPSIPFAVEPSAVASSMITSLQQIGAMIVPTGHGAPSSLPAADVPVPTPADARTKKPPRTGLRLKKHKQIEKNRRVRMSMHYEALHDACAKARQVLRLAIAKKPRTTLKNRPHRDAILVEAYEMIHAFVLREQKPTGAVVGGGGGEGETMVIPPSTTSTSTSTPPMAPSSSWMVMEPSIRESSSTIATGPMPRSNAIPGTIDPLCPGCQHAVPFPCPPVLPPSLTSSSSGTYVFYYPPDTGHASSTPAAAAVAALPSMLVMHGEPPSGRPMTTVGGV